VEINKRMKAEFKPYCIEIYVESDREEKDIEAIFKYANRYISQNTHILASIINTMKNIINTFNIVD